MSMLVNPFMFGAGGTPNPSDIIMIADAEPEASPGHIVDAASISTGITDAHGRTYNQTATQTLFEPPGGQERFVSLGQRFRPTTDADGGLLTIRRISGGAAHVTLQYITGGTLRVAFGSGAANHDSSPSAMTIDHWYYSMLYADINDAGSYIGRIFEGEGVNEGDLLVELAGSTDTYNAGNLAENLGWGSAATNTHGDHIWLDINGVFRGCGRVNARVPNGTGASAQWSRGGTDTGNNWDQVNAMPTLTSGNPSHVFATAADQIDLYEFEDINVTGDVISVRQVMYGRARSGTGRQFKALCRIGGVNYEGSQTFTSNSTASQAPMIEDWKNNPATGNAWADAAEVNSAQFGYKSVTDEILVINTSLHVLIDIST